jgi:sulfate adenylyltransferase subunit 2
MSSSLRAHLRRLEEESIHIMREVVTDMRNRVMLYSIGKDSSVMLHVALKASHFLCFTSIRPGNSRR